MVGYKWNYINIIGYTHFAQGNCSKMLLTGVISQLKLKYINFLGYIFSEKSKLFFFQNLIFTKKLLTVLRI